jgi:biotin---protein ligase
MHLSSVGHVEVDELLYACEDIMEKEDGEEFIRCENDRFHIEKKESRWSVTGLKHALPTPSKPGAGDEEGGMQSDLIPDYNAITKTIVPHSEAWPDSKETPHFDHGLYFKSLQEYRVKEEGAEDWGNLFMYGEVLTSTNTLLEK